MKAVIFDEGFIPGLGRGPFRTPIEITEDQYNLYKRMGLKIINATKTVPVTESGIFNRQPKNNELELLEEIEKKEKEIVEIVPEITVVNEISKEIIEEKVEEEIDVNNEEKVEEEIDVNNEEKVEEEEIDINNLTKKELMKLLTDNNITFPYNANKTTLLKIIEEKL